MKTRARRERGKRAMDLIEEAFHLVRLAPASVLAAYFTGAVPFVIGFLYFWADMSRSPYAAGHLAGASLGLALLFLWMKCWQTFFTSQLRGLVGDPEATRWDLRRWGRVVLVQTAYQPSGLLVLPVALLILGIPFGWAFAFYQNITTLGDGRTASLRAVGKPAWRQAFVWPGQNHLLLVVLSGFGLFVFIDLATVSLAVPWTLKTFLGIQTVYSQSPLSMLNSTFFAGMFALTYLCVDPLVKATYTLRSFYGESVESGEDLKALIRSVRAPAPAFAALLLLACALNVTPVRAQETAAAPPAPAGSVSPEQLDKSIDEVVHEPRYAWRLPRDKVAPEQTAAASQSYIGKFLDNVLDWLKKSIKGTLNWIGNTLDRLFRRTPSLPKMGGLHFDWINFLEALLVLLILAIAGILTWYLVRNWKKLKTPAAVKETEALPAAPDLHDENVGATELPEDGWLRLARELIERGELRLALRALYFASLAHLAARNLITIARFKSNRDYERELHRRGHALPDLLPLFGENVSVFDRSWYGRYEVSQSIVSQFAANVDKIQHLE